MNKENKYGETPLYVATWKGHTVVILYQLLLFNFTRNNIDVNKYIEMVHQLYEAAYQGHTCGISMLFLIFAQRCE